MSRAIMLIEEKKKVNTIHLSWTRTRGPSHLFVHLLLAQPCDEPEAVCSSLVHRMLHVHREDVPLSLSVSLLLQLLNIFFPPTCPQILPSPSQYFQAGATVGH